MSTRKRTAATRAQAVMSRRVGGKFTAHGGTSGARMWPSCWHYLAITNTTDLVWLHTAGGLVVLSPSRPDEFAARLAGRLSKEIGS